MSLKRRKPKQRSRKLADLSSIDLAKQVATFAEAKKGIDISILDVSEQSSFADCFVVVSGSTAIHLRALADGISEQLAKEGMPVPRWQGDLASHWVILDLGRVVVHLFGKPERAYYNLEGFWEARAVTYHV